MNLPYKTWNQGSFQLERSSYKATRVVVVDRLGVTKGLEDDVDVEDVVLHGRVGGRVDAGHVAADQLHALGLARARLAADDERLVEVGRDQRGVRLLRKGVDVW